MAKNNKSPVSVAKNNLKTGLGSPGAKVGIGLLLVALGLAATASFKLLNDKEVRSGEATAEGYGVQSTDPRGAISDGTTVQALEKASDKTAAVVLERGGSFAGPFSFEVEQAPKLNVKDGFDESGSAVSGTAPGRLSEEQVMSELQRRASDMDLTESQVAKLNGTTTSVSSNNASGSYNAPQSANGSAQGQASPGYAMVDAQGKPMPYGLTDPDFKDISGQLSRLGTESMTYKSLANGRLANEQKAVTASAAQNQGSVAVTGTQNTSSLTNLPGHTGSLTTLATNVPKRLALEAGTICPGILESTINTDFPTPVFVELQDCKDLTGAKFKGIIQSGPGDFVVVFNELFLSSKHDFKIIGKTDALSVNVDKDGQSGVAENVDNHWGSRLTSAALLSLAKTEKQFLTARGTTQINTGISSSTTIQPLTDKEKNDARIAGLMEGSMDVITRDTQYGVNRKATMTRSRGTVIGIQFLSNVEVTNAPQ